MVNKTNKIVFGTAGFDLSSGTGYEQAVDLLKVL
jgi:hypothetical protein